MSDGVLIELRARGFEQYGLERWVISGGRASARWHLWPPEGLALACGRKVPGQVHRREAEGMPPASECCERCLQAQSKLLILARRADPNLPRRGPRPAEYNPGFRELAPVGGGLPLGRRPILMSNGPMQVPLEAECPSCGAEHWHMTANIPMHNRLLWVLCPECTAAGLSLPPGQMVAPQ